jgi:hypothetical protein
MAAYENNEVVSLIAGEDLRDDLHCLLAFEDDSNVAKVIKAASATAVGIGVLAENPRSDVSTDGYTVPVTLLKGIVKMIAQGTITAGEIIIPTTTAGKVEGVANTGALAADQMGLGIALVSAVADDVFPVLAMPIAAPHSA